MVIWTYQDLTNWIDEGCDPEIGLSVEYLNVSNCTIRNLLECVFSNAFLQTTHT